MLPFFLHLSSYYQPTNRFGVSFLWDHLIFIYMFSWLLWQLWSNLAKKKKGFSNSNYLLSLGYFGILGNTPTFLVKISTSLFGQDCTFFLIVVSWLVCIEVKTILFVKIRLLFQFSCYFNVQVRLSQKLGFSKIYQYVISNHYI